MKSYYKKSIQSDPTIATNPHLFAAYLNLARHNAFLTVTEICKRLGKGEIASDDQLFTKSIFDYLEERNAQLFPNQAQKAVRLLYRHFPFLETVEREMVFRSRKNYEKDTILKEQKLEPHELRQFFEMLFKALNEFRNFASHPGQDKPSMPVELIACMKQIYDAAKRRTKTRMNYEEEDVKHLDRWTVTKNNEGEKTTAEKVAFEYKLDDGQGNLTDLGLAYFICFFLDKKQGHLFLNQFDAFKILAMEEKQTDSAAIAQERKKAVAAFEVFTDYRMRIPSLRIESEASQDQLFMDMLGELKRCPVELFNHISVRDQDRFWVESKDEEVVKALQQGHFTNENEGEMEVLLLRHDDRFAALAMRFLDESLAFQQLRFMVDLGNYHHKVYPKEIGGEWQMRRLTQKLLSFGRLQDFSIEKLYEKYGDLVQDPSKIDLNYDKPYIAATHPHYHYFEDNVAVKFADKDFNAWPSLESEKKSRKPNRGNYQPDFFISRDELFSIALYATLTKSEYKVKGDKQESGFSETEKVLMQYRSRMKKFFTDVKSGDFPPLNSAEFPFLLKDSDKNETLRRKSVLQSSLDNRHAGVLTAHIPDDLLDYLIHIGKTPVNTAASQKLERMIEQTGRRLRRLESDLERDKIGKANHREVKKGTLGAFIAKDLMMFQPVDAKGKGKATGLLFQTLQASIAFYMRDRTMLRKLFKACGLIGSENPHPFLGRMRGFDQMNGVIDFYRTYLEARQNFLQSELNKCHQQGGAYASPHWLKMNRQSSRATRSYGPGLAGAYLEVPMNLARGLFLRPIKEWMLQNGNDAFRAAIQSAERTNSVYLLRLYFDLVLQDGQQDFYESGRNYKIFNLFNELKKGLDEPEQFYKTAAIDDALLHEVKVWISTLPEMAPVQYGNKGRRGNAQEKPVLTRIAAKKALTFYQNNERRLRQVKAQDMALFLMAKELLRMSGDKDTWQGNLAGLKLRDIVPDVERGPLSEFISFELTQEYGEMLNGVKKPEGKTIKRIIRQSRIKIKNYGDFRRFLKDRRLNNLMFYFDSEVVERAAIERELDEYDRNRIRIFELIRAFEDKAAKRWPELARLRPEKTGAGLHQKFLDKYFASNQKNIPKAECMRNLRNSYFHNEFPDRALFPEMPYEPGKSLSARFLDYAKSTYGDFSQRI